MDTKSKQRALAARDAHVALIDLKRIVEEIARTAIDAERVAVGKAINHDAQNDSHAQLQQATERFDSPEFTAKLSEVRQKLKAASGF